MSDDNILWYMCYVTPFRFFLPEVEVMIFTLAGTAINLDVEDASRLTVSDFMNILVDEEEVNLSEVAKDVFSLWMTSRHLGQSLFPYFPNSFDVSVAN